LQTIRVTVDRLVRLLSPELENYDITSRNLLVEMVTPTRNSHLTKHDAYRLYMRTRFARK